MSEIEDELGEVGIKRSGRWILPMLILAIAALVIGFWTIQASHIAEQEALQERLEETVQRSVFVAESVLASETCEQNPDVQICVHSQKLIEDFSEIEREMEK